MKSRHISSLVPFQWIGSQYNPLEPDQPQTQTSSWGPVLGELLGMVHDAIPLAINKRVGTISLFMLTAPETD